MSDKKPTKEIGEDSDPSEGEQKETQDTGDKAIILGQSEEPIQVNAASSDAENNADQKAIESEDALATPETDGKSSDQDTTAGDPEAHEQKKHAKKTKKAGIGQPKRARVFVLLVAILLFLFVIALAATAFYLSYENYKTLSLQASSAQTSSQKILEAQRGVDALNQAFALNEDEASAANAVILKRLNAAEQRLEAQQRRILSMSTTSREDWLLAEAEYLLKLANQRVLIERKADSAIALFAEADVILRDLGDTKLFPLREEIKRDLVALKLAKTVDVEGIYLELAALVDQVDAIPLVPQAFNYSQSQTHKKEPPSEKTSFARFLDSFKSYFRVINHEEKPAAILPPEATAYLHLNLRFMLERAQLALLREQPAIYTESLNEAERWVKRYFPSSQVSDQYQQTLKVLSARDIVVELPDVSASLNLLKSYISDLHTLNPSLGSPAIKLPDVNKDDSKKNRSTTETNGAL